MKTILNSPKKCEHSILRENHKGIYSFRKVHYDALNTFYKRFSEFLYYPYYDIIVISFSCRHNNDDLYLNNSYIFWLLSEHVYFDEFYGKAWS